MTVIDRIMSAPPTNTQHLHCLLEINQNSAQGFAEAAELVEDRPYADLFKDLSHQRELFAEQVQTHIEGLPENTPDPSEYPLKARMHRWWVDLGPHMAEDPAYPVLDEAVHGEQSIELIYHQALQATPMCESYRQTISTQLDAIRASRRKLSKLRDVEQQQSQHA